MISKTSNLIENELKKNSIEKFPEIYSCSKLIFQKKFNSFNIHFYLTINSYLILVSISLSKKKKR